MGNVSKVRIVPYGALPQLPSGMAYGVLLTPPTEQKCLRCGHAFPYYIAPCRDVCGGRGAIPIVAVREVGIVKLGQERGVKMADPAQYGITPNTLVYIQIPADEEMDAAKRERERIENAR